MSKFKSKIKKQEVVWDPEVEREKEQKKAREEREKKEAEAKAERERRAAEKEAEDEARKEFNLSQGAEISVTRDIELGVEKVIP